MEHVIAFPGLGLEFTLNRVAINILGKDIYWYGIIICIGFLVAACYASRKTVQFGYTKDNLYDLMLLCVPIAIVCARLYYVIFQWADYKDNPAEIVMIWHGGLAIYGGILGAVATICIYGKRHRLNIPGMLDVAACGIIIGQIFGRWGNFMNREAHGCVTDSFFKMGLVDAAGQVTYYHPTFLYESVWNLVGFIGIHFLSRKKRKFDGEVFLLYIGWYGLGRAWIEGLRTDSLMLFSTGVRVSQLVAIVSFAAAAAILAYVLLKKKPSPDDLFVNVRARQAAENAKAAEQTQESDKL